MSSATPNHDVPPPTAAPGGTGPASAEPPAADRAYRHVKTGLLDGTYPDGHLLSEGEVATAMNMSRTPVREAFLRLQTEGFLRLYPKRGALVVPVTPTEARAVLEARLALESFAIDKIAADGPATMRRVGEDLSAHAACDGSGLSTAEMHEADRDFHARLVAAAANPIIDDLYNALRDRQLRITAGARTQDRRPDITRQHAEVATAVRDGAADTAKAVLRDHLLGVLRALGVAGGPMLEPPA
ncbi:MULTISPECIES: GntR family transcriptional regulator [Saccharopolyspora]|uniref:GntR family transcriptional regulator n=1 Tax=Saccharopolyspora TaxID=1835 RepID=UPI001CD4D49F|nr:MULTISPECIES: GntR family transcriptional regulator [unclassified Saccharopolyspora]MCA1185560.1 GntR family transcriptional regulator [Saccharopolyspora sp. 6T]MCA1191583.1 GntR family transcriptional regulator [Saccharopolyspora sp. 6V]MCA1226351.1 GntR family transcriptional regulator [Saccharopolyspora sp. 6M]MCA1283200.1 GntR family transcriptional regulator [Saccharopolyspora sp. 7B]